MGGVSIFRFDPAGRFRDRIEAKSATLEPGYWRLEEARFYASGAAPVEHETFRLRTNLTPRPGRRKLRDARDRAVLAAVRPISSSPKTPAWPPSGYRLQYYQLLAQPFYLVAMVLLAAAVSLRFFRFGGVQKIVLGGIAAGFLLYVLAKITGDLSKAGLMAPVAAAALPPAVGGVTGLIALLYQEDG